jgi:hypothetical protein
VVPDREKAPDRVYGGLRLAHVSCGEACGVPTELTGAEIATAVQAVVVHPAVVLDGEAGARVRKVEPRHDQLAAAERAPDQHEGTLPWPAGRPEAFEGNRPSEATSGLFDHEILALVLR